MINTIIAANPTRTKQIPSWGAYLHVSEFFSDTIQGEGVFTGHPATFLRLQGCSLNCLYCDSKEVWREGNPYSVEDLLYLIEHAGLVEKLKDGQHLVITGGSPLLQQASLAKFIQMFIKAYKFKPFIEVENEAVILPILPMLEYVDCWNNSPKLQTSGMSQIRRYKPDVLQVMSSLENSWFKFVISTKEDWWEVVSTFSKYIKKDQIILMPEGATRAEVVKNQEFVLDLAVSNNVRYSDRLHIQIWDKRVGV